MPHWEFQRRRAADAKSGRPTSWPRSSSAIAALNTGNNAHLHRGDVDARLPAAVGHRVEGRPEASRRRVGGIDEAWAGRPADGTLRITNDSRIWNVRDVVLVSEALAAPVLVPLRPRSAARSTVTATFLFPRRGLAHVSTIDSYTRYPFGFFLKKRRLRVSSDVIVYPRILADDGSRERFRAGVRRAERGRTGRARGSRSTRSASTCAAIRSARCTGRSRPASGAGS